MKILITGGLGFIGAALARRLIEAGHDLVLVDNLSVQVHGAVPVILPPLNARVERLDVRELAERYDLLEGCDAVFHLAAETGTAQSMYRIANYVSVNELGTAALLEGIGKCVNRPKHVILASSRSVYGEGAYESATAPGLTVQPLPRGKEQLIAGLWDHTDAAGQCLRAIPTPENLPFAPGSVYASTKASQELLLRSASEALGFSCTIFRFQNVYGEGQSLQNPYTGIISIFFNRARQGLEIPIYEDGLESRDFVHVSDVTTALEIALEADMPSGQVINLGSGEGTSVLALAKKLLAASGCDTPVRVTGQFRVGDIRHCYASLAVAQRLLGYVPKVNLADGLARFCQWASTQPIHQDRLEFATAELRKQGLTN
jgi:dTDP-L-rhamnose 4-epimerase